MILYFVDVLFGIIWVEVNEDGRDGGFVIVVNFYLKLVEIFVLV